MNVPLLRQTWTMSAVLINMFGQGAILSFPSSLLPALSLPDSPIKVDLNSASWIASIGAIACIPGFLVYSLIMAYYGRKAVHIIGILPAIAGWLIIYFAKNATALLVGRFVLGLASAGTVSLGAIVIGEYTCPRYRGVFLYLKNAAACLGVMFIHAISRYLHWRTTALVSLVPFLIALSIVFTWPESPAWLASKQEYGRSREMFYWLRGHGEASRKEIEDIIAVQKAKLSKPNGKRNFRRQTLSFFRKFTQKDFLKPLSIVLLATSVLELSGKHFFPPYALHIMTDITKDTSMSFYYTLAIDFIITTSSLFASCLVRIINRRSLLFTTGSIAIFILMSLCLYLFLVSKDIITGDKQWISVGLLVLYFIFVNLGCTPIPFSLVGEIFPLEHRAAGAAVSGVWIALLLLVGLKSTPHLIVNIGVYGCFGLFGSIMGLCLLILYFIMPETKDKTLIEIESNFNDRKIVTDIDYDEANTNMIK